MILEAISLMFHFLEKFLIFFNVNIYFMSYMLSVIQENHIANWTKQHNESNEYM